MGSWSATIMGSDDALDAKIDLLNTLGVDEGAPQDTILKALNDMSPHQWRAYLDNHYGLSEYLVVKKMVVAVVLMEYGAHLPAQVAEAAIEAARTAETASWRDPEERKGYLDQLVEVILDYDRTPTKLPEESLGEVRGKKHMKP